MSNDQNKLGADFLIAFKIRGYFSAMYLCDGIRLRLPHVAFQCSSTMLDLKEAMLLYDLNVLRYITPPPPPAIEKITPAKY